MISRNNAILSIKGVLKNRSFGHLIILFTVASYFVLSAHGKSARSTSESDWKQVSMAGKKYRVKYANNGTTTNNGLKSTAAPKANIEFPSLVQIYNKDYHLCSGTLLSDEWVLTAAHCILSEYPGDYLIVAGGRDRDKDEDSEQLMVALKIIQHEDYQYNSLENDIALIQLIQPFDLDPKVQPALLPKLNAEPTGALWTGDFSKVLSTEKTGTSSLIQSSSVPIVGSNSCKQFLPNNATGAFVSSNLFCAGPSAKEACLSTSGGPVYSILGSKQTVVGVNSWDEGCARIARPAIYTKVSRYIQWIQVIMKNEANNPVKENGKTVRIVGGWDALPYKYPSLVLLKINRSPLCGGTILSSEWVLTAAHCVISQNPSSFVYVAAEFNKVQFEGPEQSVTATKIIVHERYNTQTHENDIALMRVYPPFAFNAKVQPVNLPPKNYDPKGTLWVAGWGAVLEGGRSSSILQELYVNVIDSQTCINSVGRSVYPASMLCAGWIQGGYDSCQGDSGGPLYYIESTQQYLMGVVSWGIGCGRQGKPGIYTRVPAYVDWIYTNMRAQSGTNNWQYSKTRQTYNGSAPNVRIVGGKEAVKYHYTSLVVLKYKGSHICSGTILSAEWILTAAHCIRSDRSADYQFVAGEYDKSKVEGYEQNVQATTVIKHLEYNTDTLDNDIALLKVKPAFKFNDKVKAATLPTANFKAQGTMWVAGWGVTKYGGYTSPDILQDVDVPIVDQKKCAQILKGDNITNKQLCAGWEGGKKDACQGDSGGPLYQVQGTSLTVVGIISWGRACALKGIPGVYTRVSSYLSWINGFIRNSKTNRLGRKIVATGEDGTFIGKKAAPHSYPSVVLIKANREPICPGTIISEDWVLTSADCVDSDSPTTMQVIAGKHDSAKEEVGEQMARVVRLFWHQNYSASLHTNDIALLKVSPPFQLNDKVSPAKLPQAGASIPKGKMNTVGWEDKGNSHKKTLLQELEVSLSDCPTASPEHICVDRAEQSGKIRCYGDPGGPLFQSDSTNTKTDSNVIVGIVSGNTGCFSPNKPGLYTNVAHYIEWIQENMEQVNSDPSIVFQKLYETIFGGKEQRLFSVKYLARGLSSKSQNPSKGRSSMSKNKQHSEKDNRSSSSSSSSTSKSKKRKSKKSSRKHKHSEY